MQVAPRLLAIGLFAALSLGAMVLLSGCSGCQGTSGGTAYSVVVTGTSGTVTETLTLTLSAKK
jgi:hypothetical protein